MMSSDPTDDLKLRVLAGVVLLWDDEHPPVRRDFEILNEKLREAADRIDTQAAEIERLQGGLSKALRCISKHQGGCINGCWEDLNRRFPTDD